MGRQGRGARATVTGIAVAVAMVVFASAPAAGSPFIHAHRGGAYVNGVPTYPESTMPAFEAAAAAESCSSSSQADHGSPAGRDPRRHARAHDELHRSGQGQTLADMQRNCRADVVRVPGSGLHRASTASASMARPASGRSSPRRCCLPRWPVAEGHRNAAALPAPRVAGRLRSGVRTCWGGRVGHVAGAANPAAWWAWSAWRGDCLSLAPAAMPRCISRQPQ
jgi:hypothetical protein